VVRVGALSRADWIGMAMGVLCTILARLLIEVELAGPPGFKPY